MEDKMLSCAIKAAILAGQDILNIYNDPDADFEIESKADNSPLTIADKRSNERIMSFLKNTPYPILSEEGKHMDYEVRQAWDTLWIVDPLDGTKEFIKKNGEFTVNIALVEKAVPVSGVIYVPVTRELYFASYTIGAYKMEQATIADADLPLDELIKKSRKLPLPQPEKNDFVVVASRSHLSPETADYIHRLETEHKNIRTISSGSSLKICRVAEGRADIYPRFAPTMEWDTAAGHAIARAAGKNIYHTDETTPLSYNKKDLLNPWFIVK